MDIGYRRLAAILIADVVGYSRMVAEDEDGTLSAFRAHLNAIEPVVLNAGGRVVKTTGDGILVEFPSAVAAVNAAVDIQDLMWTRNHEIPMPRRMQFRLGINLGDVVIDDAGDVFGDGVNVAARVESVAEPGGVSLTDAVYQAVIGKVDLEFTDDGDHDLKNVQRPVKLWKVGASTIAEPSGTSPVARTLATVAVMPFDNMSGDAEQEYFADGITEDILTALSYNSDIAVIARNSTFAHKGKADDIRSLARMLDATHVVEGSVRRSGSRLRVTVQLIDAETGHHVWAERYDRDVADVFDVQDELVDAIAAKLTPALWDRAASHRTSRNAASFDAWDLTIQGQFLVNTFNQADVLKGIGFFDRARDLEPEFVAPVARSATAWMFLAWGGWRDEFISPWERGEADAQAAYRLDGDDYWALSAVSLAAGATGSVDDGARYARRMIEINPFGTFGFHMLGNNLDKGGLHGEAISALTQAWRLGRHEPSRFDIANDLSHAHFMSGSYEPALRWGQQSLDLAVDYLQAHMVMAATFALLDRTEEGRRHANAVLEKRPDFSCTKHRSRLAYVVEHDRDRMIDGLLKAGLPA